MQLCFTGEIWFWRGPSPYHFVWVPEAESAELDEIRDAVSYGWGVLPVRATIGGTTFTTSLFPKEGRFLVPVKDAVRKAEGLEIGVTCEVRMTVEPATRR